MIKLLKEWAVVCKALDEGKQIILARKGGLEEREFTLKDCDFLFYPTYVHQKMDFIKPEFHAELEQVNLKKPRSKKIYITNFAKVIEYWNVTTMRALKSLDEEHIWSDRFLENRFRLRKKRSLLIIAIRVYRLPQKIILPVKDEYAGCKSWIKEKDQAVPLVLKPVLSDWEFEEKRSRIGKLLTK